MGQRMQETLYQTGDAGDTLSTGDAGDTLWDSGYRRHSIRQDAGDTLWGSGGSSFSMGQVIQETLYETADAGDTL